MTEKQKRDIIKSFVKAFIRESERGNNFGAIAAKFDCCVRFNFCEKQEFDRIAASMKKGK